ncbi:MAG TPA: hypothetical protein VGM50_07670 [Gemmatimonadaceae bacterium]
MSPGENVIVVHAVLDAAASDQYVIIQLTTGATRTAADLTGAQVMIVPPTGGEWIAREELDSVAIGVSRSGTNAYRVNTVYHVALGTIGDSIVPGGRYQLRIVLPTGATVIGSTTVPNVAAFKTTGATATPFDIAHDALTLHWQRVVGARGYEVQVHSQLSDYSAFADTSITLDGSTKTSDGQLAFIAHMTNQLVISAVDSNYFDYFRRGSDPFSGVSAVSHLNGALGVFGSIVELQRVDLAVH